MCSVYMFWFICLLFFIFFFKQKTAYEMRISDWSSDVCSSDLLTRAIRRLEEELGGPLIYRDGKNSRLTALGHNVEMEFKRMQVALRNVRQHSDNWALCSHRVLDIAIAPTVNPNAFTSFFLSALEQVPSVGIKIRALQSSEDTTEVLSGKYHACILPREPRPDPKLDGCS